MSSAEILLPTARTPQLSDEELEAAVRGALPAVPEDAIWRDRGDLSVRIGIEDLHRSIVALRDESAVEFKLLVSITVVHWPEREREFELVYHLRSLSKNVFMALKTDVAMGQNAPTVSDLYLTADWQERECYDMFGIEFDGHPDLRRILMPQPYPWFPMRKDFPLEGPDFPIDAYQTDALGKVDPDDFWGDAQ